MIKKFFAISAAAVLAGSMMLACSSSSDAASKAAAGNCPAVGDKGPCANDGTATQSDVDACNNAKSGSCGSQFTDYYKCAGSNAKCGSDGKTDSASIQSACKTQSDAYAQCLIGGAGGDGG